ncbi:MAG: hypothetical protein HY961_12580 [Ignavibacteriae bacterium]|nr:hypothetical protein [Ignavibacteriota bacterium]
MKPATTTLAAIVALLVIGCSNSSNPTSTDASSALSASTQGGVSSALAAGSGGSQREVRIEGTITAIDATYGTVTIRGTVVQTGRSTKIERNGYHATLAQFRVGDRGQARWAAGQTIATKVEAVGN